jgi:hypothetical protein
MNDFEQDELLKQVFEDEALGELRKASLEMGLDHLRRKRRQRRLARLCLIALAAIAAPILFWGSLHLTPEKPKPVAVSSRPAKTAPTEWRTKIISDEELFALFPNRPMALIGKPGQQELVLLDQAGNGRPPEPADGQEILRRR